MMTMRIMMKSNERLTQCLRATQGRRLQKEECDTNIKGGGRIDCWLVYVKIAAFKKHPCGSLFHKDAVLAKT